jgi:hypothetical protein
MSIQQSFFHDPHGIDAWLQTVGVERFLRYRKRFFEHGIHRTLRAAEPELTTAEIETIVQAGRRIVGRGYGLEALALAKGRVPDTYPREETSITRPPGPTWLVGLGGLLFAGYLGLSLGWAGLSIGEGDTRAASEAAEVGAEQPPQVIWTKPA